MSRLRSRPGGIADAPAFDVFVSYNSARRGAAQAVVAGLRRAQIRVWVDTEQVWPGDDVLTALPTALATSAASLFLIGEQGLGDGQNVEYKIAFNRVVRHGHRIIPVLIDGLERLPDVPLFLPIAHLSYTRLVDPGNPDELARLAAAVRGESIGGLPNPPACPIQWTRLTHTFSYRPPDGGPVQFLPEMFLDDRWADDGWLSVAAHASRVELWKRAHRHGETLCRRYRRVYRRLRRSLDGAADELGMAAADFANQDGFTHSYGRLDQASAELLGHGPDAAGPLPGFLGLRAVHPVLQRCLGYDLGSTHVVNATATFGHLADLCLDVVRVADEVVQRALLIRPVTRAEPQTTRPS